MSQPGDRPGTPDPIGGTAHGGDPWTDRPTEVLDGNPDPRHETLVVPPWSPPRHEEAGVAQRPAWQPGPPQAGSPPGVEYPTQPQWSDRPVVVRRSDTLAGLLLLLAGLAAGTSLLVVWLHGGRSGMDLVRDGFADLSGDTWRIWATGSWQPLAVVLGGGVLFLIGLLLYVPAHTHRFLGALALLVAVVVAAGVLVPLSEADWDVDRYAVGGWLGVAVAGLGFLGALKALMTGPKIGRRL
jgi:hypothetical protein